MDEKKIHKLLDHALSLEEFREKDVRPYVSMEISNFGIEIRIKDKGIDSEVYDGIYKFDLQHDNERMFRNCQEHLIDLYMELDSCKEDKDVLQTL